MTEAMEKPVIAISGKMTVALDEHGQPKLNESGQPIVTASKSVLNMKALLEAQGAEVVILHPVQNNPADAGKYAGIVLMGNDNDIDPARYGQTAHKKTKVETQRQEGQSDGDYLLAVARADFEYKLIEQADKYNIPFFGVCGGYQRYNVAHGGTLIQHIDGEYQSEGPSIPVESVQLLENTRMAQLAGENRLLWKPLGMGEQGKAYKDTDINSFHHQAIDKLGDGLRVSGMSGDVIEAIESTNPNHYVMGVQWHPEFMPDSPLTNRLVGDFVEKAKAHSRERERSQEQEVPATIQLPSIKPNQRSAGYGLAG